MKTKMVPGSIHKQSFSVPSLPTHSVTIYPSRAAIVRDISVTILPGRNEITLEGLTSNAEEHSIKVECRNTASLVTEMVVDRVANPLYDPYEDSRGDGEDPSEDDEDSSSNSEGDAEVRSLKNALEIEKGVMAIIDDGEASHRFRLRMLDEYLQSWVAEATKRPSRDISEELSAYHESHKKITTELRANRCVFATLNARIAVLEKKLAKAEVSKSRSAAHMAREFRKRGHDSERLEQRQTKLHTPEEVYRVRITVDLESPPKSTTPDAAAASTSGLEQARGAEVPGRNGGGPSLRVYYVVRGAFWTPKYDVRLDTLANTGILTYHAHICNRTGETWGGTRITLSTSQTSFGGLEDKAPLMDPWRVSLGPNRCDGKDDDGGLYSKKEIELREAQERRRLAGRHEKGECGSAATLAAPSNPLGIATATTESYGLTTTYDVPGTRTVISSDQLSRYIIAEHKLTDVISHHSVPKLCPSVFLKARICNPFSITLLHGPAGLSLDGAFLGTATIPFCAPGKRFELDLGVDERVHVDYREPVHTVVPQGTPGEEQLFSYGRYISIYNTRKNPISLAVFDQVPVSDDGRLKVHLRTPVALRYRDSAKGKAAGIVVIRGDKEVVGGLEDATAEMTRGGEVKWESKVEGGTRIRIELEYEAKLPKVHTICEA